ncbi:MAG: porin [Deltaproteobacteria bacterium]|nr:porin [Deltaproteobacteria bacterium]
MAMDRGTRASGLFKGAFRAFSFLLLMSSVPALAEDPLERFRIDLEELKKENEALQGRIDALEAEDEETRHGLGLLSNLVEVSGYADAEYAFTDREGEDSGFRIRHLSLFFTKDIQREWKLFTEVEFEDAPRIESEKAADTVKSSQGTIFVEQLYIEYHPMLSWDIRLGRFLTPAGVWSIYHYPPYVPTQTSPIIYKEIFPKVSDGVQLKNSFSLRDSSIDTHLYVANGAGNPGALDRNESKGIGARLNADLLAGLSTGFSYFGERDNDGASRMSYGGHILFNRSALRLQAEYQIRSNETDAASGSDDSGWYAQAEYDIGKWTLAARYDWYDPSSESPDDLWTRATAAVNYRFAHNVVGKIEFNSNGFDDPSMDDYSQAILGVAVAIGDL